MLSLLPILSYLVLPLNTLSIISPIIISTYVLHCAALFPNPPYCTVLSLPVLQTLRIDGSPDMTDLFISKDS